MKQFRASAPTNPAMSRS